MPPPVATWKTSAFLVEEPHRGGPLLKVVADAEEVVLARHAFGGRGVGVPGGEEAALELHDVHVVVVFQDGLLAGMREVDVREGDRRRVDRQYDITVLGRQRHLTEC